ATVVSSNLLSTPPGTYQANVVVPCVGFGNQPLVLTANALPSSPVLIPIAAVTTTGPRITPRKVVSAAGYVPLSAGSGLAQGSYIYIGGCGLGSTDGKSSSLPYTTSFNGASVTVTPASGSSLQAYITYADAGQINAILPSTTPLGDANVTVTYNNATS